MFLAQPGMAEHALRDPRWGDTIVALHEEATAYLVRVGFTPGGAFLAVRAIADLVEAHTMRTSHHARLGTDDLALAAASHGHHPTLQAANEQLGSSAADARFSYALRCLVRGLEVT